jgi:hypothetical protein
MNSLRRFHVEKVTKYVPCGLRFRLGFKGIPQRLKPLSSQTNTARLKSCPSRALFLAAVCRFGTKKQEEQIKIEVEGVGQECPTHTYLGG